MSTYAEMERARRRARPLFLELRALGLDLWLEQDSDEPPYYRIVVGGLRSLSPTHANRVIQRVSGNEAGLAIILLGGRWDFDFTAIRQEGECS